MNVLTVREIFDLAVPVSEPKTGLYFLFYKRNLMYVGQSKDIDCRIAQHRKAGKLFDAVAVQECGVEELDVLESLYIHAFDPLVQGRVRKARGSRLASPVSLADLQVRLAEYARHPVICVIYGNSR